MGEVQSRAEQLARWRERVDMRLEQLDTTTKDVRTDLGIVRTTIEASARWQARVIGIGVGVMAVIQVGLAMLRYLK